MIPADHDVFHERFVMPADVPRRPKSDITGRLWAVVGFVAVLAFMLWLARMPDARPMPCGPNEALVWADYPTDAGCEPKETP